ncbi:MAG TPA: hypothetical protein VFZ02_12385 [Ktedonobacteraceae bacterium]
MTYDPQKHHRRSIRMQGYDHSDPGAYFVTICTDERRYLFGEIIDDEMHLNDIGQAVQWIWNALPERFPTVELDQYIIMPNHIHGIIILHPYEGAMNCAPTLGLILRTFKALATHYLHAAGASDFARQRNYHEHITRKEGNLDGIRQYIIDNPLRWTKDSLHIKEALL